MFTITVESDGGSDFENFPSTYPPTRAIDWKISTGDEALNKVLSVDFGKFLSDPSVRNRWAIIAEHTKKTSVD